ncbi:hypothetical protein D3C77_309750 [compost metagenome]
MLDGFVGVEYIDVDHAHQRERVFLAAHVLQRGEIEHIVVSAIGFDKSIIFNGTNIQRERLEITIDIPERAADIAHQLNHVVLADIDNMQFTWTSLEDLFGHRLANRTSATKNQKTGLADDLRQLLLIFTNVINEQVFITTNETQNIILHIKDTNLKFSPGRTCKYVNNEFNQLLKLERDTS